MRMIQQEPDRLADRRVLGVTGAVVVATALGVVGAWWVTAQRAAELGGPPLAREGELPLPDEVSDVPMTHFEEERDERQPPPPSEARRELDSWGWVDRRERVVHIPIDVAMDLVIARQREVQP